MEKKTRAAEHEEKPKSWEEHLKEWEPRKMLHVTWK